MRLFFFFTIISVGLQCSFPQNHSSHPGVIKQDLNEAWTFKEKNTETTMPAEVPGVVHTDLLRNKVIEDPYYGNNEKKQKWIEEKDWEYSKVLQVEKELLQKDVVELVFEGLDTYAEVKLNGQVILTADNMFRTWRVNVKPYLQPGENTLQVLFTSPINKNRETVQNYKYKLPSGNETDEVKVKTASFTRKAAYQFGWDWGPRFVTSGIWKPVYLQAYDVAKIENVFTYTQDLSPEKAELISEAEVNVLTPGTYQISFDGTVYEQELQAGKQVIRHKFEIENPKLWWSNGSGEAHLYNTEITLAQGGKLLDKRKSSYGVRTIELINEPDSIGTAFYFKLNGKATFMKGANYIPQDVFLPRVSDQQYEDLILAMKGANMNMVRVWGGGIYEKDLFYDLCDKHGILVWQDFMFAGSLYPDFPEFRANVRAEVRENIKRLRNHPSIALWCGNNEIEVAWNNWGWQTQYGWSPQDSTEIWQTYLQIFEQTIPEELEKYDPTRAYTSTSPLSNWGTPENFNHSSMHYWGVWHGRDPFEKFPENVGRFMVEYGFQSFPDYAVLEKVIPADELDLESETMKNRQKSYIGNGLILKHVEQYYDSPENFADFVELSQKTQAKGMQMAIRSHMDKRPHCMGTLFWQLNDCWPGPSWSVIDYYGNKKAAYEVVKEEYKE